MDRCSGLQPTLCGGLSRQKCGIEQNAARDDAVFQGIDTSSRTTARGLDLIHGYAVITLAVGHDVTIHRIEMAVDNAVIAAAILVTIQSDTRADINDGAFQNRRGIDGTLLNDIVGQRYRNSVLRERQRLLALGRRNQVGSAEFIFFTPASPIGKLLHGPPEIRVGCDFWVCIVLSAGSVDKQHDDQRDSNQGTGQASNTEIHSVLLSRIPRDYNNELRWWALFPSLHHRKETSELLSQRQFFVCRKFGSQRRSAQFQAIAIHGFVVWRSGFPAAKDDAYPFKSESAESGVMRLSALAQLVIKGASPVRLQDRTGGKLLEGLPQEFRTSQAPVNPNAGTAFFGDRSNAGDCCISAANSNRPRSDPKAASRRGARIPFLLDRNSCV